MAYTEYDDVKTYAGINGSGDDALISDLIGRAQAAIDAYTGRTFETGTSDTTRKFTVGIDTEGKILYLDEDLADITSIVTNADGGADAETLTTGDYITHPRNRTPYFSIEILSSSDEEWFYTTDRENGVTVEGKWAYSTTPPADIVHACIRLATYYYRQKDAGVFDVTAIPDAGIIQIPQGIPKDVKMILDVYKKGF